METQNPSKLKLLLWGIVILAGFLCIGNIAYSTYTIWRRRDLVLARKETLKQLETEQIELKNQLSDSMKPSFIEKEARNKLGFAKEGEVIILLPEQASESSRFKTYSTMPQKAIWREWIDIFLFGS